MKTVHSIIQHCIAAGAVVLIGVVMFGGCANKSDPLSGDLGAICSPAL